jgi:hypothetical protein
MSDHNAHSAAAVPASQRPERWIARSLKRHPLLAFPAIWVAGIFTFDFTLNFALRGIAGPLPSLGFFYVFIPLVFSLTTAGFLLASGAWRTAISRGKKIILIVGLAIESVALPSLHLVVLWILFWTLCAADHSCP